MDGITGFLADTVEEAAERVSYTLRNLEEARKIGKRGIEHVRSNFLMTERARLYSALYRNMLPTHIELIYYSIEAPSSKCIRLFW